MQTDAFKDIRGYEDVKNQLGDIVRYVSLGGAVHQQEILPRRILLHGPPGTGKTQIARNLINIAKLEAWYDPGSLLIDSKNDGLRMTKFLFDRKDALIILDEADYVIQQRRLHLSSSDERRREAILDQLMLELELLEERNIIFIAITNRIKEVHPKFWQLMDRRIEIPLPDFETRQAILIEHGARMGVTWSKRDVASIADRAAGASGRRLARLVDAAKQDASKTTVQNIRQYALDNPALLSYYPGVTPDIVPVGRNLYIAGITGPNDVVTVEYHYQNASANGAQSTTDSGQFVADPQGVWFANLEFGRGNVDVKVSTQTETAEKSLEIASLVPQLPLSYLEDVIGDEGLALPDFVDLHDLVDKLDDAILGQDLAKQKLGFAANMHYAIARREQENPSKLNFESNVVLIGPNGNDKEALARGLANVLDVPFARQSAQNIHKTVSYMLYSLYQQADGDQVKAEHSIVFIDELDKLATTTTKADGQPQLQLPNELTPAEIQNELVELIEGKQVELFADIDSKEIIQFYTGNLFFVCAGVFSGLQDKVKLRTGNTDPLSYGLLMSNVVPQDLVDYGLNSRLMEALSMIILLDDPTMDELKALVKEQWHEYSGVAYQEVMSKQGIKIELTESGMHQMAQEARNRKMGINGVAAVIRDIFSYIWVSEQESDYIVVDKSLVSTALIGRSVIEDEINSTADGIFLAETPDITYDDIGGLEDKIGKIRKEIEYPYLYANVYQQYGLERPKGILLHGPPGTGKTMIAKAIANSLETEIKRNLQIIVSAHQILQLIEDLEGTSGQHSAQLNEEYLQWVELINGETTAETPTEADIREHVTSYLQNAMGITSETLSREAASARQTLQQNKHAYFLSVKGAQLANKWVGTTEEKIRNLFQYAKIRASPTTPVIIFFDEIDALFGERGSSDNPLNETVVPTILAELDGVETLSDVIVIGATNRDDVLDQALTRPGRMDFKLEIPRPNRESAHSILDRYLNDSLPYNQEEVDQFGSLNAYVDTLKRRMLDLLYSEQSRIRVLGHNSVRKDMPAYFPWQSFISGAVLKNIVWNAKRLAANRAIENRDSGIIWQDLYDAIVDEFEQNKKLFGLEPIRDQLLRTGINPISVKFASLPAEMSDFSETLWKQPTKRPWLKSMLNEIHSGTTND